MGRNWCLESFACELVGACFQQDGPYSWKPAKLISTLILLSPQPILYSYFRSSCSWRVRIGKSSASG